MNQLEPLCGARGYAGACWGWDASATIVDIDEECSLNGAYGIAAFVAEQYKNIKLNDLGYGVHKRLFGILLELSTRGYRASRVKVSDSGCEIHVRDTNFVLVQSGNASKRWVVSLVDANGPGQGTTGTWPRGLLYNGAVINE